VGADRDLFVVEADAALLGGAPETRLAGNTKFLTLWVDSVISPADLKIVSRIK
jgi:hypothetical protein